MLSYFIQLESVAVIIYFGLKLSQINRSPFKLVSSFWDIPTYSLSTSYFPPQGILGSSHIFPFPILESVFLQGMPTVFNSVIFFFFFFLECDF